MSLEEALKENTAALKRLADLIERDGQYIQGMQQPVQIESYVATCDGTEAMDTMPVVARTGDRRQDVVTEAKLEKVVEAAVEKAVEHAAPAIAEAVAEKVDGKPDDDKPRIMIGGTDMVLGPDETIPEFTWEGIAKQFRKYANKHGRDEAVKLAKEFGLSIPLNKDELTQDRYEEFYYACSN